MGDRRSRVIPEHAGFHQDVTDENRGGDGGAQPQIAFQIAVAESLQPIPEIIRAGQYVSAEHKKNAYGKVAIPQNRKERQAQNSFDAGIGGGRSLQSGVEPVETPREKRKTEMSQEDGNGGQ